MNQREELEALITELAEKYVAAYQRCDDEVRFPLLWLLFMPLLWCVRWLVRQAPDDGMADAMHNAIDSTFGPGRARYVNQSIFP